MDIRGFLNFKKLTITISCLVFAFGCWSAYKNKVQLLPNTESPKISFRVIWPGVNENFLIGEIAKPYEDLLIGKVNGLKNLLVETADARVTFEAEFEFGVSLYTAQNEIASQLAKARPLPLIVDQIEYSFGGRNVSNRVVGSYFLTSTSDAFDAQQRELIKFISERRIEIATGVDKVEMNPVVDNHVLIKLDLNKISDMGLGFEQVRGSILDVVDVPSVRINTSSNVVSVKYSELKDINDFKKSQVAYANGVAILIEDIASVSFEQISLTATARFNGRPAIAMRVLRFQDANLTDVQNAVTDILLEYSPLITQLGLEYHLSFDTALFIDRTLIWVFLSICTGFLLSLLVSITFFKNIYPTVLGAIVTLLSVSAVFSTFYLVNASINVISLAGITFAIGLFVDGVFVVVEKLDRTPLSDRDSVQKIQFILLGLAPALLASTLTTVVVFLPVVFASSSEGQLFSELSVAIVSGVIFSFLFTFLITPFFADEYLQYEEKSESLRQSLIAEFITSRISGERAAPIILIVFLSISISGLILLFPSLNYLPSVKRDAIDVFIPLPGDLSINAVEENYVEPLSNYFSDLGNKFQQKNAYVLGWSNFVTGAVRLEDNAKIEEVSNRLKSDLAQVFPNDRVITQRGELFGGVESSNNVELYFFVSDNKWISENANRIRKIIVDALPGTNIRFDPNIESHIETLEFSPNYDVLKLMEVSPAELKHVIRSLGESDFVAKWSRDGEVVDVILSISGHTLKYDEMPYTTSNGKKSYLSEMFNIESINTRPSLNRINGLPVVKVNLRVEASSLAVAEVIREIEKTVLPLLNNEIGSKGFIELKGSAASLDKALTFLRTMVIFVFLSFLVIVAIVLRSIKLSLCVIASLIPSLFGGVLGFLVLNAVAPTDFNVLTVIGFMMMLGIVANNSILLVDSIRRYLVSGMTMVASINNGISSRSRAILGSSFTTILGMLPLLILPSEASEIYRGIAAIIIGGMTINLLSVFFVTGSAIQLVGLTQNRDAEIV